MAFDPFVVNENIRKTRQKKNMTVLSVSAESGISRSHLHYIETKKVSPTVETICKLADVLDVNVVSFFEKI